jgi:hypothetical protein
VVGAPRGRRHRRSSLPAKTLAAVAAVAAEGELLGVGESEGVGGGGRCEKTSRRGQLPGGAI